MFNEIKKPVKLNMKTGGANWKERHPKLDMTRAKRIAKVSYLASAPVYVTQAGGDLHKGNMAVRAGAYALPAIGYGAHKHRSRKKKKK